MVFDDLFQDVPHDGLLLLHHFFGLLDGGDIASLFEPVVDKRLEQLERHFLGQSALVQLEFGTNHDHGTSGIVHALAQKVLAETSLLALEGVGERFERAVVGATQHAAAATVIEQSVNRLLQHALFIAHDHFRGVQVHQLLQTVVAVDYAAVEIVEIRSRETAAIQWNQRTELGWYDRNDIQDHPVRLVAALAEGLDNLEALSVLEPLLQRALVLHLLAQLDRQAFDVDPLEKFLDCFRTHHGLESCRTVLLVEFAELGFVLDDFAIFHRSIAGLDYDVGFEVEDRLEVAQGNVEQVSNAAGQALEEPNMRAGRSQLNVTQSLTAHFGERNLHTAFVADHAAVLHALVLAAQALPVGDWAENAGAEQAVPLWLEGPVVDGLRFGHFPVRPAADLFRGSQTDANRIEVGNHICHFEWARTKQGVPPLPAVVRHRERLSKSVPGSRFSVAQQNRLNSCLSCGIESSCRSGGCFKNPSVLF